MNNLLRLKVTRNIKKLMHFLVDYEQSIMFAKKPIVCQQKTAKNQ